METKDIKFYLKRLESLKDLLERINPKFEDEYEYFNTPNYTPDKADLNLIEELFHLQPNELVKQHLHDTMSNMDKEAQFYVSRGVDPKDLVLLLSHNDAEMFPGMTEEVLITAGKIKVRKFRSRDCGNTAVRSAQDCKRFEMCDLKGLD